MKNKDSKDLGEFGLSALALDRDFSEMDRLSDQLEELDVESEYGFEQSCKPAVGDSLRGSESLEG